MIKQIFLKKLISNTYQIPNGLNFELQVHLPNYVLKITIFLRAIKWNFNFFDLEISPTCL
uniref:Uncharacterized protein n=1 Tax=Rhizophagus irregularis (strain DAOM 181602 / DAOM 197198 / MUCL 43194) TaxID=747089 RepID=U9URJ2_RHIID